MMLWAGDTAPMAAALNDPNLLAELGEESDPSTAPAQVRGLLAAAERRPYQWFTHTLLHADPIHLAGNLLFLVVLGSRVNALIGNILSLILYPLLGVAAAAAHIAFMSHLPAHPMLGASGAIMGLSGMYLVLFPLHPVHMAAWIRWGLLAGFHLSMNIFPVRGFWVVLFYIAFDVIYTILRVEDGVAHWAHLGGFAGGVVAALALLLLRIVNARGGDALTAIAGRRAWLLIGNPNRDTRSLW